MTKLLTVFVVSMILAYMSEKNVLTFRCRNGKTVDIALIAMCIVMSLFCGLRTSYNDTWLYIEDFKNAPLPTEYLAKVPNLLGNPAFYLFQSVFKFYAHDNPHLFLFSIALFSITTAVWFIKKYAYSFTVSIIMYFSLGLYIFNFAAVKQCIAIAIILIAIDKLLQDKYLVFFVLIFIAMLFHAYALMTIILPLFVRRPWKVFTYVTIALFIIVLLTFESTISDFLDLADDLGKSISDDAVFNSQGINIFRLAVFFIPVLISFIARNYINNSNNKVLYLFTHMSILSFLVMFLGLSSAANLFGRSANYFQIGSIIILPQVIKSISTYRTARGILTIASICYIIFLMYGNIDFNVNHIAFIEIFR